MPKAKVMPRMNLLISPVTLHRDGSITVKQSVWSDIALNEFKRTVLQAVPANCKVKTANVRPFMLERAYERANLKVVFENPEQGKQVRNLFNDEINKHW